MSKNHSTEEVNKIKSKQMDNQGSLKIASHTENISGNNSKIISSKDDRVKLTKVLRDNTLVHKDIFITLIENPTLNSTMIGFLTDNKDNSQWKIVKDILVKDDVLQPDKLKLIASIVTADNIPIFPSQSKSTPDSHSNSSSPYNSHEDSDYIPSDHSSNSTHTPPHYTTDKTGTQALTRSNYPIEDRKIRGKVSSYAKASMGGFRFEAKDGITRVLKDSVIERPIKVTGNLGQEAGDHVIPIAYYTKYIGSLVNGKELFEAFDALRGKVASYHEPSDHLDNKDSYQAIIDKSKALPNVSTDDRINAAEFLRAEFIPSVIAIWNQKKAAAFKGHKTSENLGNEGVKTKELLNLKFNSTGRLSDEQEIKRFVEAIDYKPIAEEKESSSSSAKNPKQGIRNNSIDELSYVIGKIDETYATVNNVDANENAKVMNSVIGEMFEQHGWQKHFDDLGKESQFHTNDSIKAKDYIYNKVLESNPHLSQTSDIETVAASSERMSIASVNSPNNDYYESDTSQDQKSGLKRKVDSLSSMNSNSDVDDSRILNNHFSSIATQDIQNNVSSSSSDLLTNPSQRKSSEIFSTNIRHALESQQTASSTHSSPTNISTKKRNIKEQGNSI